LLPACAPLCAPDFTPTNDAVRERPFLGLALELFALQYDCNASYRLLCQSRGAQPDNIKHWTQIPAVPTSAFKEFELSCLPAEARTRVFHSSGTTAQVPSRHFHNAESLALYEDSLWPWFAAHLLDSDTPTLRHSTTPVLLSLTPQPALAPHSSLVHMFDTVQRKMGQREESFFGTIGPNGEWSVDFEAALAALQRLSAADRPVLLMGTAFSCVHLTDFLAARGIQLELPGSSRALETGGYKGRSRDVPKSELYSMITASLGIDPQNIVGEYGMSELSSQGYDKKSMWSARTCPRFGPTRHVASSESGDISPHSTPGSAALFQFPPWARARVVSMETGREVAPGEMGLLQVLDLANVWSVMSVQTADLAVRRAEGFELIGRAALAEPRGCSLMAI
jgi:hypothetical protein